MPIVSPSMDSLIIDKQHHSSDILNQPSQSGSSRFNRLLSKLAAASSSSSSSIASLSPSSSSPSSHHSPASSHPPSLRTSMEQIGASQYSSQYPATSGVPSTPVRYALTLDVNNVNHNNIGKLNMLQTPAAAQSRPLTASSSSTAILPEIDEMTPLRPPVFESRFMRDLAANNTATSNDGSTSSSQMLRQHGQASPTSHGDAHDINKDALSPPAAPASHSRSPSATSLLSRRSSNRSSSGSLSYQQHHTAATSTSYASAAVVAAYTAAASSSSSSHSQAQSSHYGSSLSKGHSPPPAPSAGMAQRSLPRTGSSNDLNYHYSSSDLRTNTSHDTSPGNGSGLHRKTASLAFGHRTNANVSQQSPRNAAFDHSAVPPRQLSPPSRSLSQDDRRSIDMLRSHSSLGFYASSAGADKLEAKLYGSPRLALSAKDVNVFATPGSNLQHKDVNGSGSKLSNFAKSATNALGNLTRKISNDALNTFAAPVVAAASMQEEMRDARPGLPHRGHSDLQLVHSRSREEQLTDVDVPLHDHRPQQHTYTHDKATPGYPRVGLSTANNGTAPLTAGLSESSKRFRSAFRMNKTRGEHGSAGRGQPGITPGLGSRRAMRVHREAKAEETDEDEGHMQLTTSVVLQSDSDRSPDDVRPSMQSTDCDENSAAGTSSNLSPQYWGSSTSPQSNDAAVAMQARYENAALAAEPVDRSEDSRPTYKRPGTALGLGSTHSLQTTSSRARGHEASQDAHRSERQATRDISRGQASDRNAYEPGIITSSSTSSVNSTNGMDSDTLVAQPSAARSHRTYHQPTTRRDDAGQDSDEEVEVIRDEPNTNEENVDPAPSASDGGSRSQTAGNASIVFNRPVLGQLRRPLQQHQHQQQPPSTAFPTSQADRAGKPLLATTHLDPLSTRISKSSNASVNSGYHPVDRQVVVMSDYAVPIKAGGGTPPDARPAHSVPAAHNAIVYAQAVPAQSTLGQDSGAAPRKTVGTVTVKGKTYTRMGLLGRGGSSKVFRVSDRDHQIYALKKVDLGKGADSETYQAFLNEIDLLERLQGHDRIIQLVASEVNEARRSLIMVMEIGEIDLNALLQERQGKRVSMNFIRHTWEQMLEAVNVIHEVGIVHTDLKPANFVLVKGALKLIDFGIAKAIPNDTTNIARDQQIGTANYMSPEALSPHFSHGPRGERIMKLGRPSDVWSLGCILFQIVYGHTPFGRIKNLAAKMAAIQTPGYQIEFLEIAVPLTIKGEPLHDLAVPVESDLLRCVKSCLRHDPKKRITIPQLLEDPFLRAASASVPPADPAESFDPEIIAQVIGKTLQWSRGRQPDRVEQERFMEAIMRQLHAMNR